MIHEYKKSGNYGTVHWGIDEAGTMTFRPADGYETGKLAGLSSITGSHPWFAARNEVEKIVFEPAVCAGEKLDYFFHGFCNLKTVEGTEFLDTSQCKSFHYMFEGCYKLEKLDLSSWNMSSAERLDGMFTSCNALSELNLSGWDTGNVVNMSSMFVCCHSLEKIDVEHFDTSSVIDMTAMFGDCQSLKELNLSNWDTSSVQQMSQMFLNCTNLEKLDVSNWDTSSVKNFGAMFRMCESLTDVNIENFDLSSAQQMSCMFANCSELRVVKLPDDFHPEEMAHASDLFLRTPIEANYTEVYSR